MLFFFCFLSGFCFCFSACSISYGKMLKSSIMIADLSLNSFFLVSFCYRYLEALSYWWIPCPNNTKCSSLFFILFHDACCCLVAQSCLILCDCTDCTHQASLSVPSPRTCSKSYPSSWWCHPTISSSVVSFSSCPQSFPASGPFLMSQLFISGGQNTGASASASVILPMKIQGWFPLGLTSLTSLQSMELSRVFSNSTVEKHQFFSAQLSLPTILTSIHEYWKNHSFD